MSNSHATHSKPSDFSQKYGINWDYVRRDFPILDQDVNTHRLAYLDSAASSQVPRQTIERMSYHLLHDHSNVHRGVHALSQRSTDAVEETRYLVARMIGANEPAECIFVRGATEGVNLVSNTLRSRLKPGDNVVLTTLEHHSNIVPWYLLKKDLGIEIRVVDINDDTTPVHPADVVSLIDERTKLLGIIHVSNALGTINPIDSIIAAAKEKHPNLLVLVDGCQAALHVPIDVKELGADFYTFSAHKMCAPTGIGVLWGKRSILEELPPFMGGGDMILSVAWEKVRFNEIPHKFEAGTPSILPIVGLGESIKFLDPLKEGIAEREKELGLYFIEQITQLDGVKLLGPPTMENRVSTFSLIFDGVHPHDVGTILSHNGVAIRAGHHCTQPLMKRLGVPATARASLAFYNNSDDVDQFVEAARQVKEIFQ